MWRLWDRDLQQMQDQWDSDKESMDGIVSLSSHIENGKQIDNIHQDSSSRDSVILSGKGNHQPSTDNT